MLFRSGAGVDQLDAAHAGRLVDHDLGDERAQKAPLVLGRHVAPDLAEVAERTDEPLPLGLTQLEVLGVVLERVELGLGVVEARRLDAQPRLDQLAGAAIDFIRAGQAGTGWTPMNVVVRHGLAASTQAGGERAGRMIRLTIDDVYDALNTLLKAVQVPTPSGAYTLE